MVEVKHNSRDVNDALKIVYDLRDQGYVINKDFEWRWNPTVWKNDNFSFDEGIPAHCLFTFHNEALATWFMLKYL